MGDGRGTATRPHSRGAAGNARGHPLPQARKEVRSVAQRQGHRAALNSHRGSPHTKCQRWSAGPPAPVLCKDTSGRKRAVRSPRGARSEPCASLVAGPARSARRGTDGALPLGTARPTARSRCLHVVDLTIYSRTGAGWAAAPHAPCCVRGRPAEPPPRACSLPRWHPGEAGGPRDEGAPLQEAVHALRKPAPHSPAALLSWPPCLPGRPSHKALREAPHTAAVSPAPGGPFCPTCTALCCNTQDSVTDTPPF